MPRKRTKSTMPKPSFSSDSPAILICSDLSAFADLRTARTAIGSVGEMRAPKSRHQMSGIGCPTPRKIT
jgi:hypothetical protein